MPGWWEAEPGVLVCILHVDVVNFNWACGLRRLRWPGPFQEPLGIAGMPYDHGRNAGCMRAIEQGATHLFFLDSDVVPPADAVYRLLRHNKPFISGMYCRRSVPHAVPVMMRDSQWVTDLPKPGQDPVIEVDLVGAGCMLLSTELLRKCPPQREGKHWFDWRVDLKGNHPEPLSEDFTFVRHIKRALGVPILVDTSVRCKHVGFAEADYNVFAPVGSTPFHEVVAA
jgi:hypothetical protein